jgi:hypothetical protein
LVLLVSVVVRKPLLLPFFQAFGQNGADGGSLLDRAAIDPASRKRIAGRISFITTVIGFALFADRVAHVILALTLSTNAYLGASRPAGGGPNPHPGHH